MGNTLGNNIKLTLFGESRGDAIGCVLDGVAPGIKIDMDYINHMMELRKPHLSSDTSRHEADEVNIISGVYNGYTTGSPLTILINNKDITEHDSPLAPRPGHSDFTQYSYSLGYGDIRGGGHLSGRLTAPIVAAGAIYKQALEYNDIYIGSHIESIGNICDEEFSSDEEELISQIHELFDKDFPVISESKKSRLIAAIDKARNCGDSIGGIIEGTVYGLDAGIGEPYFDGIDSRLAAALFGIPGVVGVSFGDGFAVNGRHGSENNDEFYIDEGFVKTTTNHCGGLGGGISNGMPIRFHIAVKPTPSIGKPQKSFMFENGEPTTVTSNKRNDACILPRVRAVIDSVVALTIADIISIRYGTSFFGE